MSPRLTRLARLMDIATLAALCALPLSVLAGAWMAEAADLSFPLPEGYIPARTHLWAALAVGTLPMLALGLTLWRMHLLFRQFRRGDVLTHGAARLIRRIGTGLLAVAVLRIAVIPVQSLIVTLAAPPGSRQLLVSLSSADLGFLLAAGLMAVIGWVMEDAAHAAEENRGFV